MIYLVEDDESIRELVVYTLNSQGLEAQGFERPSLFWKALEKELPSLVLLDIMLPEEDGLSILKKIRIRPDVRKLPVIMLTAKGSEFDTVVGLDSGADDYIPKPFRMMELISRVRALLRRSEDNGAEEYRMDNLYVCPGKHEVTVDKEPVNLTLKNMRCFVFFLKTAAQYFPEHSFSIRSGDMSLTERAGLWMYISVRSARSLAQPEIWWKPSVE